MNYGLTLSASGMLTAMHRMDVAANNLANVNTVAFKPDLALSAKREAARIEDGLYHIDSNTLLERLGAGALSTPTITNFTPSAPELTNNPLDVAILGEGFFILESGADGDEVQFSRDGRFTIDDRGRLVSATTGQAVLNDQDQPIFINRDEPVHISTGGVVEQNGRRLGRIQIASVPNRNHLVKIGENLYHANPAIAEARFPTGSLVQPGAIETSGVNPIRAMLDVTDAGTAVRNNTRLMEIHDQLMDRAINNFGRIT